MTSYIKQKTIKSNASCSGVGVHSGEMVTLTLKPASENSGITFIRTDVTGVDNVIPARWDLVTDTRMCTVLTNDSSVSISTVEHVLSALYAKGIDNAIVEVDGVEIPIMDGSSALFIGLIEKAGIEEQSSARKFLRIKSSVSIESKDCVAALHPAKGQSFNFIIDFDSKAIGKQSSEFKFDHDDYNKEISAARTFGFLHEVEAMRKMGLAKGGSLENAIIIDGDTIMNPEGLRYDTEFSRHKLLDAIGDMALCGGQMIGHYDGIKSGHKMNNELLRKLFATKGAWEFVELTETEYNSMSSSSTVKNDAFFVVTSKQNKAIEHQAIC